MGGILAAQAQEQYKRISRDAVSDIVDGKIDAAIESASAYLDEHPDDLESMFVLAAAFAQKNDLDQAYDYVRRSVDAGLPLARYLAGPRDLLEPLHRSEAFQQAIKEAGVQLLHGPLLGAVTDRSARFWVRTAREVSFQVVVSESERMEAPIKSQTVHTQESNDFTAVAEVEGLRPGARYFYEIHIDDQKEPEQWSFRTFPQDGSSGRFEIGFGGGAGYTPQYERMWNTIRSHNPLAFLLLGDNVYIDNPTRPAVQQYCYYRRQSRPEYRLCTAETAVFSIWDDHDFVDNDNWGGPEIGEPAWKIPVWRLYRNNWNNPSYGGGEKQPGCWFNFSIGDVDFIMLDGRYYRTDPKTERPSMLGSVQKEWLFHTLKSCRGVFKVIASPVPWAFGAKPGSLDPWQGYREEREEIFSFIEANKIGGVILISADRHRSDAWKIERENGYDFYEFESSKISNIHTHGVMPDALFGYNKKCSFGHLTFDTAKADPEVVYKIFSIDDELIHQMTIYKSQLAYSEKGAK
ncbi:MAG: alkaline phosphatase D family protein [Candidatus Omnitrophica bacterium]|nr:alkaline phosphatase D family protein [Candidatus Omnitrophota bacterium]